MVEEFSWFQPLLTEHLADPEGELLPYLLLGDVVRWADAAREVTQNWFRVATLFQWMEIRFVAPDAVVEELIAVGFVEMLPATPTGEPLLELLCPSWRQMAQEMTLFEPWGEQPD